VSRPVAPRAPGPDAFPVLRWLALAWILVWAPAYLWRYGPNVFLNLCDIAVFLTALGLWRGSPLLLSSQALSSLVIDTAWVIDLAFRALAGRHLVGGTEYMWDPRYPVWLRALSLFHVLLPLALVHGLRQVGYDRRAFGLQAVIAVAAVAGARLLSPEENLNFAWRDPWGRTWGPAPVHVAVIAGLLVGVVCGGTHAVLSRVMPVPKDRGTPRVMESREEVP
jgi:hypothetical protein